MSKYFRTFYGPSCMRASLPKKTENISYYITIYNSRIITYWMTLVSSEIYTCYVEKNIQSYKCWFFFFNHCIADNENDRITLNLYLTQTNIVPSQAKLALIGNILKNNRVNTYYCTQISVTFIFRYDQHVEFAFILWIAIPPYHLFMEKRGKQPWLQHNLIDTVLIFIKLIFFFA